jgi:hypothetical protein
MIQIVFLQRVWDYSVFYFIQTHLSKSSNDNCDIYCFKKFDTSFFLLSLCFFRFDKLFSLLLLNSSHNLLLCSDVVLYYFIQKKSLLFYSSFILVSLSIPLLSHWSFPFHQSFSIYYFYLCEDVKFFQFVLWLCFELQWIRILLFFIFMEKN